MCFYCILGLLLIFYMYICRILLIQLLDCHIEINACLVVHSVKKKSNLQQFILIDIRLQVSADSVVCKEQEGCTVKGISIARRAGFFVFVSTFVSSSYG